MASSLALEVSTNLQSSFNELENIWEYIGYDDEERSRRARLIADRIQKTLVEVIQEENTFRIDLETRMDTMKRDIAEVCQSLQLPPFFPPRGLSSYQLMKVLEEKMKELETLKQTRQESYLKMYTDVVHLCAKMDIADTTTVLHNFPSPSDKDESNSAHIPNGEELRNLGDKLRDLESTYQAALTKFTGFREDILRIAADISYLPNNDFERAVVEKDDTQGSPIIVTMTTGTLERLQEWRLRLVKQKAMLVGSCEELRSYLNGMWIRLGVPEDHRSLILRENPGYKPTSLEGLQAEVDRCQELKWEHISEYLGNLETEASQLSRKCFQNVGAPTRLQSNLDSEDQVNHLEQEIDRLRDVYNCNSGLYDAVASYQRLWDQYVEIEARMKDPAILSNRGGILLKTDKERKRLLKELPRIESDVSRALADSGPTGADFLVAGRRFTDYVQVLWQDFRAGQDQESKTRRLSRTPTSMSATHAANAR